MYNTTENEFPFDILTIKLKCACHRVLQKRTQNYVYLLS
jgi:hypothetical protein